MNCRVCDEPAESIIDFGPMPKANAFVTDLDQDSYRFNLAATFCLNCYLFQLAENPNPEAMFHGDYPFFTGQSKFMESHFEKFIEDHIVLDLNEQGFVLEIGSNDGTMLKALAKMNLKYLGVDPSSNAVAKAKESGLNCEVAFFNEDFAKTIKNSNGVANYIVAANVICHIPDLNSLFKGIKILLGENGKFIFEEPYLVDMLKQVSYDQIYDEHIYIFSASAIAKLARRFGLRLIDAIHQDTHGGSMRYVITHDNYLAESFELNRLLRTEEDFGILLPFIYKKFATDCEEKKLVFVNLLKDIKNSGKIVAGYGATSKSTTILNYCKVDSSLISFISDSTQEKIGKFSPGSGIPIFSHEKIRNNPPDYIVLFAWNHKDEILEKESELRKQNLKWISLCPVIEILEYND